MVVEKQRFLYGSDVAAPTILRDLRSKSATDGTPSFVRYGWCDILEEGRDSSNERRMPSVAVSQKRVGGRVKDC